VSLIKSRKSNDPIIEIHAIRGLGVSPWFKDRKNFLRLNRAVIKINAVTGSQAQPKASLASTGLRSMIRKNVGSKYPIPSGTKGTNSSSHTRFVICPPKFELWFIMSHKIFTIKSSFVAVDM